ncbi:MAG: phosphatase PAP2 family protein [Hymenobacteraceae bacterium]|nr:phosphatase PAP2 family protein [Hymenobacteraceae bacterium]
MVFISRRESWFTAYAILLFCLIHLYRRRAALLVPLLAGSVWAADFISAEGFKPITQRLRPCHEPALADTIRVIEGYGCGGQFGFMSSHAANTMALTVFLVLMLPRRFALFKWVLVSWVIATGYSRVYLAAHYPGDVLAGWVLGAALGWAGTRLYAWAAARWHLV